jgi:hypothetical protein
MTTSSFSISNKIIQTTSVDVFSEFLFYHSFFFFKATIKCESPLYEINKVDLDISNPFPHKGEFRVVLVEARGELANTTSREKRMKTKQIKPVESKTDHG